MDEIGVWMAWIIEAKTSGEIEAEAEVPDTKAGAEANVGEDVTVIVEHDEDTAGNELSKLFSYDVAAWRMMKAGGQTDTKRLGKRGPTLGDRIIRQIEAK